MKDTGGPGMVPFELSGGQHRADEILAEWGEDGRGAAREQLWIDFGFMLAYGSFLTFALAAVLDLARKRSWRRLTAVGAVVVFFGALGASFDALENSCRHRDSVLLAPARFTSCRSTRLPTCGPTYIEMPLLPQVTPEETRAG
jgi:hypothetical protein